MKPSHTKTPRTMNECHWTPGYTTARSMGYRTEPWERYADVLTAVLIGIALATLLVVWWS
jgi:hypothetical protein